MNVPSLTILKFCSTTEWNGINVTIPMQTIAATTTFLDFTMQTTATTTMVHF